MFFIQLKKWKNGNKREWLDSPETHFLKLGVKFYTCFWLSILFIYLWNAQKVPLIYLVFLFSNCLWLSKHTLGRLFSAAWFTTANNLSGGCHWTSALNRESSLFFSLKRDGAQTMIMKQRNSLPSNRWSTRTRCSTVRFVSSQIQLLNTTVVLWIFMNLLHFFSGQDSREVKNGLTLAVRYGWVQIANYVVYNKDKMHHAWCW